MDVSLNPITQQAQVNILDIWDTHSSIFFPHANQMPVCKVKFPIPFKITPKTMSKLAVNQVQGPFGEFEEGEQVRICLRASNSSVRWALCFLISASIFILHPLANLLNLRAFSWQFKHVLVDPRQYGVLMESLCAGGKYDGAVQVLDELLEKGTLLSPKSPVMEAPAYNPVIEYLCDNGNTNKAETFFRQLMKKGVDDKSAFNSLIRGHAKEGALEAAKEILAIMTRRGVPTDPHSHALLIDSFLKKNEPADAKTALDSMMEHGHLPRPALFQSVMAALFNDGRVQTASRVMKSMIEKGITENMDMAHKIVEALFMRCHVEEAIGRVNLMVENGCMPDLDKLLAALCEKDKVMEAQKLADFALDRDFEVSFSTYDRVLEALYTEEKTLPPYSMLCKIKHKGGVVDQKGCDALMDSLKAGGYSKQADILSRILVENGSSISKRGKKSAMGA
ncbi:pentatricopeptide repeat-containing protein At2g37230-like [Triticum aestivum]|nr:pentatricopeptide repeat-containing protein At2g37230-like [Triticum aestivum]